MTTPLRFKDLRPGDVTLYGDSDAYMVIAIEPCENGRFKVTELRIWSTSAYGSANLFCVTWSDGSLCSGALIARGGN